MSLLRKVWSPSIKSEFVQNVRDQGLHSFLQTPGWRSRKFMYVMSFLETSLHTARQALQRSDIMDKLYV